MVVLIRSAAAQGTSDEEPINISVFVNYVYAAQLGFGGYNVGGLDAQIYALPLAKTFDHVFDTPCELEVRAPIQYGRYRFKANVPGIGRIKATGDTLGLTPGVGLRIPLTDVWDVTPSANWGFASDVTDANFAYIYTFALRSVVRHPVNEWTFRLGNGIVYAGNAPFKGGGGQHYATVENGIGVRHPLGFRYENLLPDLEVYVVGYNFIPDAKFNRTLKSVLKVDYQVEFAFSLGSVTPIDRWFLTDERIGLSYMYGGGELDSFRVNLGFPF